MPAQKMADTGLEQLELERLAQLKSNLLKLVLESGDPDHVEKLASAWKLVAEASRAELELANSQSRAEWIKFLVPIFSAFLSSLLLLGAFVFQIYQFNKTSLQNQQSAELTARNAQSAMSAQSDQFTRTNQLAREANEDSEFRSVVELLGNTKDPRSAFGMTLLQTFFDSRQSRYASASLDMAPTILGHLKGYDSFRPLFRNFAQRIDIHRIGDLASISYNLNTGYKHDEETIAALKKQVDSLTDQIAAQSGPAATQPSTVPVPRYVQQSAAFMLGQMQSQLEKAQSQLEELNLEQPDVIRQLELVSDQITQLLRTSKPTNAPNGLKLDLYGTDFISEDLRNVDFSSDDISEATFDSCRVNGARFANVQVSNTNWFGTAWWKAETLTPELFQGLRTNFPFDPTSSYPDDTSASDYRTELERLGRHYPDAVPASQPAVSPTSSS